MKMQDLIERFPDVEVIKLTDLIPAKEVGKGPWKIYVFMPDGYHRGGKWFRDGRIKYPDEEISFHEAKQRAELAALGKHEVRVCDGMDHLVFHSVDGKTVYGETFWNEAKPDPTAGKVAKRLTGGKGK